MIEYKEYKVNNITIRFVKINHPDGVYWMQDTPVTQELYEAVTGTNPSRFKGPTLPVEKVSYDDAVAFAKKLSEILGLSLTLPSEAQWLGAVDRDHTPTTENANIGNAVGQTTPVRSYPPNQQGLYDMYGNVWEWTSTEAEQND